MIDHEIMREPKQIANAKNVYMLANAYRHY